MSHASLFLFACVLSCVLCQGCVDPLGYHDVAAKLSTRGEGYVTQGGHENVFTYTVSICEALKPGASKCTDESVWACQTLSSGAEFDRALAGGPQGKWTVTVRAANTLVITGSGGVQCSQGVTMSINIEVTCADSNSDLRFLRQGPVNTPEYCTYYFGIRSPAGCGPPPGPGLVIFGPPAPGAPAFFAFDNVIACRSWQATMAERTNCTTLGTGCSLPSLQVTYPTTCAIPLALLAAFEPPYYASIAAAAPMTRPSWPGPLLVETATTNATLSYTSTAACLADYRMLDVQSGMVTEYCRTAYQITISQYQPHPVATVNSVIALRFQLLQFVRAA